MSASRYGLRGGHFKVRDGSFVRPVVEASEHQSYFHEAVGFRVCRGVLSPIHLASPGDLIVAKGGSRSSTQPDGVEGTHHRCCLDRVGDDDTGFRVIRPSFRVP